MRLFLLVTALLLPGHSSEDLVKDLGHPSFHVRERAERSLQSVGTDGIHLLERALHSSDAEVAGRARRLLLPLWKKRAANIPPYWSYPLADMLYYRRGLPDRFIHPVPMFLHRAGVKDLETVSRTDDQHNVYRTATQLMAQDWLEKGAPPYCVWGVLQVMHANEADWRRRQQESPSPGEEDD